MPVRWIILALALGWGALPPVQAQEEEAIVVVANIREPASVEVAAIVVGHPAASVDLALHYMKARQIPSNRLCRIDAPIGETITRELYESLIRDPFLAWLRDQGLIEQVRIDPANTDRHQSGWSTTRCDVKYVALMYGVPLRVGGLRPFFMERVASLLDSPMRRDSASVDTELALALYDRVPLEGPFGNPYYNRLPGWIRTTPERRVLLVTRLDGPDPEVVRRMIDDAVRTEERGLQGRAYFDTQSTRESGYIMGDYWIREAAARCDREGLDVYMDHAPGVIGPDIPMEQAAIYMGWYAEHIQGPFLRNDFAFQPGAVAYHIHSGSAKTLRSRDQHWAGPLLARGAAVVMGAIDEPYLTYTPDLSVFTDYLCSGVTFAEAAYASMTALSWQITLVGDPLYRPFRVSTAWMGVRISQQEDVSPWELVRVANRQARSGQLNVALALLRAYWRKTGDPVVGEKLGDLYTVNQLHDGALEIYREILATVDSSRTAARIGAKCIYLYRQLEQGQEAEDLSETLKERWPDEPALSLLERIDDTLLPLLID